MLFSAGERLEASGQIAQACESFEASNKLEPRAGTMIRLGDCREAEGKLVSAWSAFKDSLTRVQDPRKREYAAHKITQLEPRLSRLTVSVPEDRRVDGLVIKRNGLVLEPVLWNRAAALDGGAYTIEATAPGYDSWTTNIDVPAAEGKVSVDVPKLQKLQAIVQPQPSEPAAPGVDPPVVVSPLTFRRKLAIGLGGAAVVTLIVGATLGIQSGGLESDAYALCPDPRIGCDDADEAQDLLERGSSRATQANVAFAVGGAMIIGAAVLWLTGAPSAEVGASVSAHLKAGGAGVDVAVRF